MPQSTIDQARQAHRSGAWDDALAAYAVALAEARASASAVDVADILRWTGEVYRERGERGLAMERVAASREAAEAAGLRDRVADALNSLAALHLACGELELARDHFSRARALAEEAGHPRLVAMVDQNLGIIANIRGDVKEALCSYRSALAYHRRGGDERAMALTLNNLGMAHVDLEEWSAADAAFSEAAALAERTGEAMLIGRVGVNRAELHLKRQQFEQARESVERSLEVFHRLQAKRATGEAYRLYGMLCHATGKPEQSKTYLALALGMAERSQNKLLQAETLMEWATVLLEGGDERQEGVLYLNRSLKIFRDLKATREVLDIERRLERLQEVYLPAVQEWGARLTGNADPRVAEHAGRVADYATRLAREVGVTGWDLTWVRVGALIHDVGHSAIPLEQRRLDDRSDARPDLLEMHPVVGASIVRHLEFPEEVHGIVRGHHERWAGTGYPDGLAGEAIPLGARIVGIADAFDVLTGPQRSGEACSREAGLRLMEREAEEVFDPALFRAFRAMVERA